MRSERLLRFIVALALLCAPAGSADAQPFSSSTVLEPSASDTSATYGRIVVLSGDTLAVSSPSFEGGSVYIYERDGVDRDTWSLVKRVVPPDACDAWSIALDGDTLVIGGCLSCGHRDDPASVYIYGRDRRGKGRWGLLQRIRANFPEPTVHEFGHAVAVDGDLLAIGDPRNNTVRTYEWASHGWTEIGRLSRDKDPSRGTFGSALGLSGATLAVGAANSCVGPSIFDIHSEGVYTFERNRATSAGWREVRHLDSRDPESLAGESLAIEGATLVMHGSHAIEVHERNHRGRKRWGQQQELEVFGDFGVRGRTLVLARKFEEDGRILVHDRIGPGGTPWVVTQEIVEPPPIGSVFIRSAAVGPREVVVAYGGRAFDTDDPKRVVIYHRDPIHADSFESGDLGQWEAPKRKVGLTAPGLGGSGVALEVFADGKAKKSFVRTRRPKREPMVSLELLLNANAVDLGGERVEILRLSGGGKANVTVTLQDRGSRYFLGLKARQNSGPLLALGEIEVPVRQDVRIRLEWQRATGEGHDNGVARLGKAGGATVGSIRLATDRLSISDLKIGFPAGAKGTAGGSFLIDDVTLYQ